MWGAGGLTDAMREAVGGGGRKPPQTVYLIDEKQKLRAVEIRTGISDGRFTEVVAGALEPGQMVVVGLVTARAEGPSGPGASGPPRMGGRMF